MKDNYIKIAEINAFNPDLGTVPEVTTTHPLSPFDVTANFQDSRAEKRLNLGSADRRIDGFVSVDITPPADQIVDLSLAWPWPDSSIEEIIGYDIAEHISDWQYGGLFASCIAYPCQSGREELPRIGTLTRHPSGRIHFMNECHRVLVPGGIARIEVPSAAHGAGYAQDPTHCQPYSLNSFQYFQAGSFAHNRLAKLYGITAAFEILELGEHVYKDVMEDVWKIRAKLKAVK